MSGNDDLIKEPIIFRSVPRATFVACFKKVPRWESNRMNDARRCVAEGGAVASPQCTVLGQALSHHAVAADRVPLRYLPTCSDYADQALERHGLWAGGWMTMARLTRCHPFGNSGLDFVPSAKPARARWYLPWRYGRWRGTNSEPPPAA
jgi:putative membrane protein insertion efficiency factor